MHGDVVRNIPEVEVLRHINLLEDVHESLFLRRPVDPVAETNWKNIRALAVVDVMTAK